MTKSPQPTNEQAGKKGFSLPSIIQFIGASSIIGIITWSLTNYINTKGNQQQQLNTFINTISDFMIQNNLDGQSAGKPQLPAVSRAARGYALNTLSTLDGLAFIEDKPKKLSLIKFLYDSELIGYCKASVLGSKSLSQAESQDKCQKSRIKLRDANLRGLDLSGVGLIIRGINLSGTDLSRANLSRIDFSYSDFSRAKLRSTKFQNSILHKASLSNAFLVDADLSNTDLSEINLDGAQLCGANLEEASGAATAKLHNITFDKNTRLPQQWKELIMANNGIFVGANQPIKKCQEISSLDS